MRGSSVFSLFPHPLSSSRMPRRRAHHLQFPRFFFASARDAPARGMSFQKLRANAHPGTMNGMKKRSRVQQVE
jgi:hypothetical protein